ncbi:MAG: M28 family peptidase [Candidatus Bathyarchaeota archaeon]|nr:M28 family peptidase [Candidatus Bathyarchaeota archaeon]
MPNAEDGSFDYTSLINAVNMTAVKEHVQFFSSLGTRATGYLGNDLAAKYIYDKFVEYGLENVTYDPFPAVDSISYGANVTLPNGTLVEIHPIVPNFVCPSVTPPEGITSKIIYGSTGELTQLDGKDVNGSIVLLDWNSGMNWLQAAQLGAEAVIFLPPEQVLGSTYGMGPWYREEVATGGYSTPGPVEKFLWETPVNFRRFYVEEDGAGLLMDAYNKGLEVRLVSTQRWTQLTGRNIIGFIEGGENPEGIFGLSSYYDSYSVVPTVAPGAQEATGISSLLELAKYLSQRAREGDKPPVSLMFIAFGGHHQALAGAMSFADKNFFFPPEHIERREFGGRVWRLFNLDLSTGSKVVYFCHTGSAQPSHNLRKVYPAPPLGPFGGEQAQYEFELRSGYFTDLQSQFPGKYEAYAKLGYQHNEGSTHTNEPYLMPTRKFSLDSEVFNFIGPMGLSVTTAYDPRPHYWQPTDTYENVNWENLQEQVEAVFALLGRSIKECLSWYFETFGRYPTFRFYPGPWNAWPDDTWGWGGYQAWMTVEGKVATFDEDIAFWKPLTKSALGNLTNPIVYLRGAAPMNRRFVFAQDDGSFNFTGAIHSSYGFRYEYTAWVVDEATGNVVYVPDSGPRSYPMPLALSYQFPHHDLGFLSLFKASTIAVLDLTYPVNLGIPQRELTGMISPPEVSIYDSKTMVSPDYYGMWTERLAGWVSLFAFPPNASVMFIAGMSGERYPFTTMTNGTSSSPLGVGFELQPGEQRILQFPVLQYAKDFYYLNDDRVEILAGFVDLSEFAGHQLHVRSGELVQKAISALNAKEYSAAYSYAVDAWIGESQAYLSFRGVIEDATSVVPFFAALILPFTFLAEKLLFNFRGYRKIFSTIGLFTACMVALYFLHPGFKLSASPANIVIGFSVLILSFPILLIIVGESGALLKAIRVKAIGVHEIEVSRSGQAMYAFSTGIENMRKRRLRTALTLVTVVVIVSSIVNFTALSTISIPILITIPPTQGQPLYEGVYIHKPDWGEGAYGLGDQMMSYVSAKYGDDATLLPRAWKYTLYPTSVGLYGDIGFTIIHDDKRLANPPKTLLGLTPEEADYTNLDVFLLEGSKSRWFVSTDHHVCIISENQAEELGIDPMSLPADITLEGLPFKVIGIMQPEMASLRDLHEEITPIKQDFPVAGENPWNEHVRLDETLIVPFSDLVDMGGDIASVSIIPTNPTLVRDIASEIYQTVQGFMVFSSLGEDVILQRQAATLVVGGMETQIVPLAIVIINVFNLMLASIHERKREISVYGAVGLSPLHVAVLFIAETLVYGVVGSVMAYLLAIMESKIFALFFFVEVNYSSSMVLFAIGSAMLAVVLSSLYPAFLSSKLVTPSLERAWKIPTKPLGDMWEIPLPFITSSEAETSGTIKYLNEYLTQHEIRDAPVFMAADRKMDRGTRKKKRFERISIECRLAPYAVGIVQRVEIVATEDVEQARWVFGIAIKRVMGAMKEWERLNRAFINEIREQLLLWRTLPESEKEKYSR